MNFDFSDDQKQLRDHVRRFLLDQCPPQAVRRVLDGAAEYDRELWRGLADLGYVGVAIPEEYGGSGAGYLELAVVSEELGRVLAPVPMSSSIYLAAEALRLAGSEEQKRRWLPKMASGEVIGTLALFEGAEGLDAVALQTSVSGGALGGTKLPVPDGCVADFAVVAARDEHAADPSAIALYIVDLTGAGVERQVRSNLDPTRTQSELTFTQCPADPLGSGQAGREVLTRVFERAAILFAFEQLGGAERALEMARDFALDRMAFGRPIGSFQAVKHGLADMYVSVTLARSNCYYGAWALSTNAPDLTLAAASARISATQAYQHCSRQNIHVHGGMGFTWEADCHLYYRRCAALALALGSQAWWEDKLIDSMQRQLALAA